MQGVSSLDLKRGHKREAEEWGYYRGVRLCLSRIFHIENLLGYADWGRFYWGAVEKIKLFLRMLCGLDSGYFICDNSRCDGKVRLHNVNFKQGEHHGWT